MPAAGLRRLAGARCPQPQPARPGGRGRRRIGRWARRQARRPARRPARRRVWRLVQPAGTAGCHLLLLGCDCRADERRGGYVVGRRGRGCGRALLRSSATAPRQGLT